MDDSAPVASMDEMKERWALDHLDGSGRFEVLPVRMLANEDCYPPSGIADDQGNTLAASDPSQAGRQAAAVTPLQGHRVRILDGNFWNLMTESEDYSTSRTLGVGDRSLFQIVVAAEIRLREG